MGNNTAICGTVQTTPALQGISSYESEFAARKAAVPMEVVDRLKHER
jgi:hypothetical protein